MFSDQPMMLLVLLLPVLVPAAALLLTHVTAAGSRQQPMVAALAICLISALIMLTQADGFSSTSVIFISLAQLAGTLVAASLLDRTRFNGILFAATTAGIGITVFTMHVLATCLPLVARGGMLLTLLIAALTCGLAGSMILPLHPSRHTEQGAARWQTSPHGLLFAGWVVLALVLGALIWLSLPASRGFPMATLTAALAAATATLVATRRNPDSLQKSGEALAAGIIITAIAPLSPLYGALFGLVTAWLVNRSEAIAQSLRIDDPAHLIGALLLPAMIGLVLPGVLSLPLLAPSLVWLGTALALGLAIAAILWPLAMLLFGFSLPPRLVREGTDQ